MFENAKQEKSILKEVKEFKREEERMLLDSSENDTPQLSAKFVNINVTGREVSVPSMRENYEKLSSTKQKVEQIKIRH